MVRRTARQWLEDLKANRKNREVREVEQALIAAGFVRRRTTKEAGLWKLDQHAFTMPNPKHALRPRYVKIACEVIEAALDEQDGVENADEQ